MKNSLIARALLFAMLLAFSAHSQPADTDADTAWKEVLQAAKTQPTLPKVENGQSLTRQQYYQSFISTAETAAQKAKAFYSQYPDSTNAIAAKILEYQMLQKAYNFGDRSQDPYDTLVTAQNALLKDPRLTDDQRFDLRMAIVQRIRSEPSHDWKKSQADYQQALRDLVKDYPQKDKAWGMLVIYAAEDADTNTMRSIANEVLASPASDGPKNTARALLRRLDAVGKPLDIKFTALDGREVDLSQMKGKVVLVDFWATWCGPCVGEIPHVKEAYDKLHSQGFEVVGISFDADKNRLKDFVQKHDMAWPQYFDGKNWQNKFGVEFAIDSIPTMWLVDKNGNLADDHAREDIQGKVEKLLAE